MRDIILAYFYGTSNISDVFLIALTIPTVIFSIISKSISVGFIPLYTDIERNDGITAAEQYTNNIVNLVIVSSTIILVFGQIFTENIVKLFASGFEGETLDLTVAFTRITLVGVYFTGLIYVYSSYLQVKGIFVVPALIGLPSNLIIVGSIFISAYTNIYFLSLGSLIAAILQFLFLLIYVYKIDYRYKIKLNFIDKNIKRMIVLASPAILGASVTQINLLIDRTMASQITEGGITALSYASTLSVVIIGIFVLSISSVIYPKIAKMSTENNMEELKKVFSGAMNAVNILVLPVTVTCMIFAEPIIELMFGRGQFDSQAIAMTSSALFFYSIGIIGLSHREILSNTFYALQDTKTPMINAAISMIVNIILNIILAPFLGISGLALASSISALFCSILLLINLRKKIGNMDLRNLFYSFIKIILASTIMGIGSKFVYYSLFKYINLTFSLLISVVFGTFIYLAITHFLKIKEVNTLVSNIEGKLKEIKTAKLFSKKINAIRKD